MSEIKQEFVCGFMFSENRENVLLIEKDRPEWQAGKLNGVGGKIELRDYSASNGSTDEKPSDNQSPITAAFAIVREFFEEVDIETTVEDWELFAISEGSNSRIYNFRAFSDKIYEKKQVETEYPTIVPCEYIGWQKTVPNVTFLVPMALHTNELFTIKCEIKGGSNVNP